MTRIHSDRSWRAIALAIGLLAVLGTGTARAGDECDDGNVCNGFETKQGSGCKAGTPIKCDDSDPCTEDQCHPKDGCLHTPIADCTPCDGDGDCGDGDACTTDTCVNHACRNTTDPDCPACTGPDACDDPACASAPDCIPPLCASAADCNDQNGCTDDSCVDGACMHKAWPDCPRCTGPDACSNPDCAAAPQCTPPACTTATECNDQNACTDDGCVDGACMNKAWPDCPRCAAPSACNDPACGAAPQCTPLPEVCDDCTDNDGDGLTDYEDPDCCVQETTLDIGRFWLKPTTTAAGSRISLKAGMTMSMEPMHDVTLQIADGSGQLFCRTIPAQSWRKGRATVFRFGDPTGRKAGGLRIARLKIRRDGRLVFRTRGKKMPLRFTAGGPARVTVRMGDQCASTPGELCPHRKALLFFPPIP